MRPVLEYCCSVWDPYYINDIDWLEKVQHFAVKLTTGKWNAPDCTTLCEELGWATLSRRSCQKLCLCRRTLTGYTHGIFSCKQFKPSTCQLLPTIYSIGSNKLSQSVILCDMFMELCTISLSSNSVFKIAIKSFCSVKLFFFCCCCFVVSFLLLFFLIVPLLVCFCFCIFCVGPS